MEVNIEGKTETIIKLKAYYFDVIYKSYNWEYKWVQQVLKTLKVIELIEECKGICKKKYFYDMRKIE